MHPIMANSKYVEGHKDKYLDTSRKILSREMLMCNMKAQIVMTKVNFKKKVKCQGQKVQYQQRNIHKKYGISNI